MSRAAIGLGSPVERFTRRMFTRIIAGLARTLVEEELSVAQVAALYLLDERGTIRIGDLGAELGRSPPSTSRLVEGLVQAGLLSRREDEADRRAKVLALTPKGGRFIERASSDRMRTIAGTLRELPAGAMAQLFEAIAGQKR